MRCWYYKVRRFHVNHGAVQFHFACIGVRNYTGFVKYISAFFMPQQKPQSAHRRRGVRLCAYEKELIRESRQAHYRPQETIYNEVTEEFSPGCYRTPAVGQYD